MVKYNGKLADPQWRHDRAVNAARARESTERLIQKIVDAAPELSTEQKQRLAVMLVTPPGESEAAS